MGYSPWGHKELDTTEATWHTPEGCLHGGPLENKGGGDRPTQESGKSPQKISRSTMSTYGEGRVSRVHCAVLTRQGRHVATRALNR